MEYRFLGPTGLKVSIFGFGNMMMRDKSQEDLYFAIFKRCYELGINFFDTAEVYGDNVSEEILGRLIKRLGAPREDLVITTKLFRNKMVSVGPNSASLSRKHIIEGIKNSLKRLQLDYVDVLYCHRPDHETPLEETIRAMNWVIEQGWAFYWGTSEWSAETIKEAYGICDKLGLIRPVVEQPQYNMLVRQRFEVEYADLFDKFHMGSTIWSPMCGGVLSGKYSGGVIPEDARNSDAMMRRFFWDPYYGPNGEKKEKLDNMLKGLKEIATEIGTTLPVLALAWTLKNKDVSCCLIGASKVEQIDENIKALEVYKKITPEVEEKIAKFLDNTPQSQMNWKSWTPFPKRR